jgi:uncharacterized protein YjbJ (UPF0337 family)
MKTITNTLKEVMNLAWQFIKRNGYSKSQALKCAWTNIKLKAALKTRICKFYFEKIDGTIREAFGTLADNLMPAVTGAGRKVNETVQTYFDTEKQEWRCFKKANLIRIA